MSAAPGLDILLLIEKRSKLEEKGVENAQNTAVEVVYCRIWYREPAAGFAWGLLYLPGFKKVSLKSTQVT